MQCIIKTFPDGKKYGYIIDSYREGRGKNAKSKKRFIYKFGNIEELRKEHPDVEDYMNEVLERLKAEREIVDVKLDTSKEITLGMEHSFNVGCLYIKKLFRELKLDKFLDSFKEKENKKYQYSLSDIVLNLICMQTLNPGSKKHTYENLEKLIITNDFELHDVYRSLDVLCEHADEINAFTYKNIKKYLNYESKIYYYDCTDFYFTSLSEDNLRRSKKSKEGIYAPLVQMGILIDEKGMLIGMVIFPGNANEQPSLKALEVNIKDKFNIDNVVICTDAGLGSNENRLLNSIHGRSFICTHSLKKSKSYIREYALKDREIDRANNDRGSAWKVLNGYENESFDVSSLIKKYQETNDSQEKRRLENIILYKSRFVNDDINADLDNDGNKEKTHFEQRLIITFSLKYYLFQMENFNQDLSKARLVVSGESDVNDAPDKSFKRLLKKTKVKKDDGTVLEKKDIQIMYTLDKTAIEEETKWFGYYATATNLLEDSVKDIIAINKERWQIEYCFRTMKSIFKARAIYLWTENHIKGHFEIIYLTLNIFKIIQMKVYQHYGYGNKLVGKLTKYDEYKDEISPYKIIETLRNMNITKLECENNDEVYVPSFKRTHLTDALGNIFNMSFAQRAILGKRLNKLI